MTDLPANKAAGTTGTTGTGRAITVLRFFRHLLRRYRGFQCLWQGIGDAVARRLADAPRFVGVLIQTDFLGDIEAAVLETFLAWQQVLGALFLTTGRYRRVWLAVCLFLIGHDNLQRWFDMRQLCRSDRGQGARQHRLRHTARTVGGLPVRMRYENFMLGKLSLS